MAIRFRCKRCNHWLGIASRKAGSEIQCPKCGWTQVVPNQEAASAAMAMDQFAQNHDTAEDSSDLMVYDDQPAPIEIPQARKQEAAADTPASATAGSAAAEGQQEYGKPLPRGMILYPRRTLYVQGLLLLLLFVVGFGSGYWIGRGGSENSDPEGRRAKERLLIEGRLVYDPGTGRLAGDRDAVIIVLPSGKYPESNKISSQGIRPRAASSESQKSVKMIRELGGEYARADGSGDFSLVVPDRGRYHLLIISNHAVRPGGTELPEADLLEMQPYFSTAKLLIGPYQYSWTLREINDHIRIDQSFARDGQ
ncbi:MAG: hypothetical protein ACYSWU_07495 [Planctomycetota bacterium]|jgi:phage FluMu protein Com